MLAAALAAVVLVHGLVTVGGKPAPHALVTFTRPGQTALVNTDSHGRYSAHLSPGTWTVRISAGVRTTPGRIVVRAGAPQTRNFVCWLS